MATDINLGHTSVRTVQRPPDLSGAIPPPRTTKPLIVSPGDAGAMLGYSILHPSWLPSPSLVLAHVHLHQVAPFKPPTYRATSVFRAEPGRWLLLSQSPIQNAKITVPYPLVQLSIGGRPAALHRSAVFAANLNGEIPLVTCFWEYRTFLFEMHAPRLSVDEVVRIAESLQ